MSRLLAFIGVVAIGVIALYISGGGFKGDERLQRLVQRYYLQCLSKPCILPKSDR